MLPDSLILWAAAIATVVTGVLAIVNSWALAIYNTRQQARRSHSETATGTESPRRSRKRLSYVPDLVMLASSASGLAVLISHPKSDVYSQVVWVAGFVGAVVLSLMAIAATFVLNYFAKQLDVIQTIAEISALTQERLREHEKLIGKVANVLERSTGTSSTRNSHDYRDEDG